MKSFIVNNALDPYAKISSQHLEYCHTNKM